MQDLAVVRAAFTDPAEFWSSPLYRKLSAVVAADPFLVELAAHARAGQGATFAFFGAVHALLLDGVEHHLGDYYPSLRGGSALPPDDAGPALTAFAHEYAEPIRELLRYRLVQTNHVQRAVGLRLALAALAPELHDRPVHLLEVGTSAGLVLRHDAYGYGLGGERFGRRDSAVQLITEWRSDEPVPDLDAVPAMSSTAGIDLNPLDPTSEPDRRWLEALVWPENREQARLLHAALALAARKPVTTWRGDAADLCPRWAATIPPGQTRIVFHCATRMHVPTDRRAAFDAAVNAVGADGPMYRIAVEGAGLNITDPSGRSRRRFDVDGHLAWVQPVSSPNRAGPSRSGAG
jgi:hypothetical protein